MHQPCLFLISLRDYYNPWMQRVSLFQTEIRTYEVTIIGEGTTPRWTLKVRFPRVHITGCVMLLLINPCFLYLLK